jgi:hypothetical protein
VNEKDRKGLVQWWISGTPQGLERAVIRRLKASRYALVTRGGLVLSLAGVCQAAMWADYYGVRNEQKGDAALSAGQNSEQHASTGR